MSNSGVDVCMELAPELASCIDASEPSLDSAVHAALAELTAQLGIPAPAHVGTLAARSPRAVRLVVTGRIMPVSLATLRRAWMASVPPELHDVPLTDDDSTLGIPDNWLRRYASEARSEDDRHRTAHVVGYLSRLAGDVMALHPGPLLSRDAAAAYLQPPDGDRPVFGSDEAQQVLRELLALGLSLRDREAVRSVAIGCRAAGLSLETVVEETLARFSSDTIQVQVNPEWLNEAITEPTAVATPPLSRQGTQAFLVVAIIRELGPLADRLINVSDVECDLADVEQSHPDLVHSVLLLHSPARLTRIFRGLLAEQVSCRDVWAILNALLRYESIPLPAPGVRLYDNRVAVAEPRLGPAEAPVADLVSFVRLQMKEPLVWESCLPHGDRAVVDAYTIDSSLERALHRRIGRRAVERGGRRRLKAFGPPRPRSGRSTGRRCARRARGRASCAA